MDDPNNISDLLKYVNFVIVFRTVFCQVDSSENNDGSRGGDVRVS